MEKEKIVLRVVDTDLATGAHSASLDETFARFVANGRAKPTLHFYRRSPPAVTLGYFQKIEEDVDVAYCENNGIDMVRRWTGGGTIYTDENALVYGLSCPAEMVPANIEESYRLICGAIVESLKHFGITAQFKPVNDVLVGNRKISGSAQFRRWGIVLQHGTIIADADFDRMFRALKPNLSKLQKRGFSDAREAMTSIARETGNRADMGEVKRHFAIALKGALERFSGRAVELEEGKLSMEEQRYAEALEKEKYGTHEWTFRQ